MRKLCTKLYRNEDGAAAVEFSLVGPIAILFVLCILEFTLALNAYLRIDEALRQATREAILAPSIVELNDLAGTPFTCNKTTSNLSCNGASIAAASSFDRIFNRAQNILPDLQAHMLTVSYSSSGVGNASTSGGTQPIVTVAINGYQYQTIILSIIGYPTLNFPEKTLSRLQAI